MTSPETGFSRQILDLGAGALDAMSDVSTVTDEEGGEDAATALAAMGLTSPEVPSIEPKPRDDDEKSERGSGRSGSGKGAGSNASGKGGAERPVGLKKYSKKTPRQYRGCTMWFAPADMATNMALCWSDKYKLDNIYRIARSQGRMEWYKEMRGSDVSLQMCLAEYSNRTVQSGSQRPTRAMTFQALESVSASTAIIIEEAGKMMCERQYMAFADSFDGGKLTETQAKNQWLVWKEQAMEPGSTWPAKDYKGPGGELRLWVKTDDSIRFQNKSEWSKTVQGRSKDIKNPKEIELEKMKKEIHTSTALVRILRRSRRTWRFTLEDKPSMDTPLTSAM